MGFYRLPKPANGGKKGGNIWREKWWEQMMQKMAGKLHGKINLTLIKIHRSCMQ
jgi:hypothetical protein